MNTNEMLQKIKENKVVEKLSHLRTKLLQDPRTGKYSISQPDISFPQDPTIWMEGFHKLVRVQVKVQLTGKKVVINLRPFLYNDESRRAFHQIMRKCDYPVKVPEGKIYAPIADFRTRDGYAGGIPLEELEEMKTMITESITKIISK